MDTDGSDLDGNGVCPLTRMLDTLGGKWKCVILWWVMDGPRRFTELRRRMPGITQKMLTQQLRDLERDGFLKRRVYAAVPPRVEYSATPLALTLRPVIQAMHTWAAQFLLKQRHKKLGPARIKKV